MLKPPSKRAIVRFGDGRGFIVGAGHYRYVITAAHCLPFEQVPKPHLANGLSELTFGKIMGRVTAKRLTIWGQLCVFNLCDDIAVLGEPDSQELDDQHSAYKKFTARAMTIGNPPPALDSYRWADVPGSPAWVLSLAGDWQGCKLHNGDRFLTLDNGATIDGGMSGSPILNSDGAAIGLISTGNAGVGNNINPALTNCLPNWLLRRLDVAGESTYLAATPK